MLPVGEGYVCGCVNGYTPVPCDCGGSNQYLKVYGKYVPCLFSFLFSSLMTPVNPDLCQHPTYPAPGRCSKRITNFREPSTTAQV